MASLACQPDKWCGWKHEVILLYTGWEEENEKDQDKEKEKE